MPPKKGKFDSNKIPAKTAAFDEPLFLALLASNNHPFTYRSAFKPLELICQIKLQWWRRFTFVSIFIELVTSLGLIQNESRGKKSLRWVRQDDPSSQACVIKICSCINLLSHITIPLHLGSKGKSRWIALKLLNFIKFVTMLYKIKCSLNLPKILFKQVKFYYSSHQVFCVYSNFIGREEHTGSSSFYTARLSLDNLKANERFSQAQDTSLVTDEFPLSLALVSLLLCLCQHHRICFLLNFIITV